MQGQGGIKAGQKEKLLLCAFIVIMGLLQGSVDAGYMDRECSSVALDLLNVTAAGDCRSCVFQNNSISTNYQGCCTFNSGLAPVYIITGLAPLMIYFPALILFNFNLASGPAQSFIFFYQALPAAIPLLPSSGGYPTAIYTLGGGLIAGLLTMHCPISDLVFPRRLPYIALQYCNLAAVVMVAVITIVLIKCIHCPCASWRHPWAKVRRGVRHFREKRAWKGTVLNGLCSIAILTYGFVIQQSFTVLQSASEGSCQNNAKLCVYYCTELKYYSPEYFPYLIVALVCLVLVLPLPLLLLYYPCVPALMQRITKRSSPLITCHKLAPVFDVFQSGYKPKLRFFAAFPLLYRLVIWLLFSILSAKLNDTNRQLIITLVFIVILAIHSLVQPYRNPRHNYIEALYLVNLVLISILYYTVSLTVPSFSSTKGEVDLPKAIDILPPALAYLPMLVGIVYFIWKRNCCKRCRAACCMKIKQSSGKPAPDEAIQMPPTAAEMYFDMSSVNRECT